MTVASAGSTLSSYTTPRLDVTALVPRQASTILDVGCSAGALGAAIKQRLPGAFVAGIDRDAELLAYARGRIDQVFLADLGASDLASIVGGRRFDCVILADVLEHLVDPWSTLAQARRLLTASGVVITSIPNVRHLSSLLDLAVRGRWPYRSRGLHDRAHLRFFTRRGIVDMLGEAGLRVLAERRILRLVDRPGRINRLARCLDLPVLRGFFTYQYLHVSGPRLPEHKGR